MKTNLTCADGKTWEQIVHVPTTCTCTSCAASLEDRDEQHQSNLGEENLSQIGQNSNWEDLSQISQSSHIEDLNQTSQQHTNDEHDLRLLTQQVEQQLRQHDEDESLSQVLQQVQHRQGRGDVAPRSGGNH